MIYTEPKGQKSRRYILQAVKNYSQYKKTNFFGSLFKATNNFKQAKEISAINETEYIKTACEKYGVKQEEFLSVIIETLRRS